MTTDHTHLARRYESEAEQYPEERAEALLDAAAAWKSAGDTERAARLLTEVIGGGGVDACWARAELAQLHLDAGDDAAAALQLSSLASDPALDEGPCQIVAEWFAGRGDHAQALRWYDRAVSRLAAEELRPNADQLSSPLVTILLRGRRETRRQLGLAPDATDECATVADAGWEALRPTLNGILAAPAAAAPRQVRVTAFTRDQRALARQRWPREYTDDDEVYYAACQQRWQALLDRGSRVEVVPLPVDGLVAFAQERDLSPTEPTTKERFGATVSRQLVISWPPQRNARCWCGSGAKYKKCCLRTL